MPPEEQREVKIKSGSKKLVIILILLIVLAGAGGGAAYYFKFVNLSDNATEGKKDDAGIFEMDTFMVNLADQGGKRFLKATIKLKVAPMDTVQECKDRYFELRDMLLTLLSSKESEEIANPDDKMRLKKQIVATANHALKKGQVLEVYFTEFLVQ